MISAEIVIYQRLLLGQSLEALKNAGAGECSTFNLILPPSLDNIDAKLLKNVLTPATGGKIINDTSAVLTGNAIDFALAPSAALPVLIQMK